ncbi:bifunctional nuclease family protein, partial [bacterium]
MDEEFVLCEVHCVRFDVFNKIPVVLLKDSEEQRFLPIWIGMFEATQIEIALEDVPVPRPMSHDL